MANNVFVFWWKFKIKRVFGTILWTQSLTFFIQRLQTFLFLSFFAFLTFFYFNLNVFLHRIFLWCLLYGPTFLVDVCSLFTVLFSSTSDVYVCARRRIQHLLYHQQWRPRILFPDLDSKNVEQPTAGSYVITSLVQLPHPWYGSGNFVWHEYAETQFLVLE